MWEKIRNKVGCSEIRFSFFWYFDVLCCFDGPSL